MTLKTDVIGYALDSTVDDAEHFFPCPECGQPIDCRDLAAVFHHNDPGHEPLPIEESERLLRADQQLREVLAKRDVD